MSANGIGVDPAGGVPRAVQDDRVPPDPMGLMDSWMRTRDNSVRPVATLATVDERGVPNIRTVLISSSTGDRMSFHTDAASAKARELAAHPTAAIAVFWPDFARQIVARGRVQPATAQADAAAYAERPRYLQMLAWLNTPELAARSREERERMWSQFDRDHPRLDPPAAWAGFELIADELLFWEGSATTASRRVRYLRADDGWSVSLIPG